MASQASWDMVTLGLPGGNALDFLGFFGLVVKRANGFMGSSQLASTSIEWSGKLSGSTSALIDSGPSKSSFPSSFFTLLFQIQV